MIHQVFPTDGYGCITRAIDAASPGDTIEVTPGQYYGGIRVRTPGVTVLGDPRAIVWCEPNSPMILIEAENVTLDGRGMKMTTNELSIAALARHKVNDEHKSTS